MAIDVAAFRTQFPNDFTSVDDAAVNLALGEAAELHGLRDRATLFCAAHLLALADPSAPKYGEVKDDWVGPLKVTYATISKEGGWQAFFAKTIYGQRFLMLERRTPRYAIGAIVVG